MARATPLCSEKRCSTVMKKRSAFGVYSKNFIAGDLGTVWIWGVGVYVVRDKPTYLFFHWLHFIGG